MELLTVTGQQNDSDDTQRGKAQERRRKIVATTLEPDFFMGKDLSIYLLCD